MDSHGVATLIDNGKLANQIASRSIVRKKNDGKSKTTARLTQRDLFKTLLYGGECFTGNKTTRKFHTPLHPGLEWRIFRMSPL